jgi:DNA mismatch endonuclease (patch repair protein)
MAYKFHTSAARAALMRKIKSSKTTPETKLKNALRREKIKYRSYNAKLLGKPDIVLLNKKVVIFVDGEFWHGYKWAKKKKKIKAHRDYWIPKIEKTIKRDKNYNFKLMKAGWKVLRFWEQEIKKDLQKCMTKIKLA